MKPSAENAKRPDKLLPILLVALTCAVPALQLYASNARELPIRDILLPLAASVLLGLFMLFTLQLILKDWHLSALIAVVGMALFLNFHFVVSLVELILGGEARVRWYYLAALLILAILIAGILFIRKHDACAVACKLTLIAVSAILAMNLVTAVPPILQKLKATSYTAGQAKGEDAVLPNLYFLLLDEYASFEEIEKYYGYDNSAFRAFLQERSFCVSETSHCRFANTVYSVSDIVNLGPVSQASMEYDTLEQLIANGTVYEILESMGYNLYQLGTLYPLPRLLEKSAYSLGSDATTVNGETATELLIDRSMLMPLKSIRYWKLIAAEGDMALFQFLDDPSHYETKQNRAIFFYICSPHAPFYYAADGTHIEDRDAWTNYTDPGYYLGQYQYITKRVEQSIDVILEHDPNAIILLQSDHGLRYYADSDYPHTFLIDGADQTRILNALYFGGKPIDIHGLSNYNTLRLVLTELGATQYPILPQE